MSGARVRWLPEAGRSTVTLEMRRGTSLDVVLSEASAYVPQAYGTKGGGNPGTPLNPGAGVMNPEQVSVANSTV